MTLPHPLLNSRGKSNENLLRTFAKAFEQEKTISAEDYEKVKGLAAIVRPLRSFIFKTPDEYGMEYQELVIPSDDGVPLEA